MHRITTRCAFLLMAMLMTVPTHAADSSPFIGNWALTIPGGGAGWLCVIEMDGKLSANILWGDGSVLPADSVTVDGDSIVVTRLHRSDKNDVTGKTINVVTTETITVNIQGDILTATTVKANADNPEFDKATFAGMRIPPVPVAPDLSKVKYGNPIKLFNGKDLQGWKLLEPDAANGWSVIDGVVSNNPVQESAKHKNYSNLRTEKEFEDFNLTTEVRLPKGGNSGIYLRGVYEIQMSDTFGRPTDSHNMGSVYSRIKPTESAEKPAGEWQTVDITLVDRHISVILNGKTIIDNQPVLGCTGGALWSDEFRPGPIYLQGDHSGVSYRNMVLKPVVK